MRDALRAELKARFCGTKPGHAHETECLANGKIHLRRARLHRGGDRDEDTPMSRTIPKVWR